MNSTLGSPLRRAFVFACIIALGGCNPVGRRTTPEPAKPLSAEDEQLKRKFQGLRGGQFRVDSLFQVRGLNIFNENGYLFFAMAGITPPHRANSSYGADFGVPKYLRFEWRDKIEMWAKTTPEGVSRLGFFYGGNILGAVFGCLLAGFYLLRVHDMATATWVAAGVNFAVAAVAWALAARVPHAAQEEPSPIRTDANPRGATLVLVAIALSGMTALGAQVAKPGVPVVSVNGDGGFGFCLNELSTMVRHGIPAIVLVFNDNAFGNVRRIQHESFGGRTIASDLLNPDFGKLADSFGVAGRRAESPAALERAARRSSRVSSTPRRRCSASMRSATSRSRRSSTSRTSRSRRA